MNRQIKQDFSPGWNEKKVRELIEHYDGLTEDEWVELIETASEVEETLISVPNEIVGKVNRLIEEHARLNGKKTPSKTTRGKKSTRAKAAH